MRNVVNPSEVVKPFSGPHIPVQGSNFDTDFCYLRSVFPCALLGALCEFFQSSKGVLRSHCSPLGYW